MYTSTKQRHEARRPPRKTTGFKRALLPSPSAYFKSRGWKLTGGGEWKNALCPFHNDTKPSLRVRLDTGGFCCMACGARGGDVLAMHMKLTGLPFKHAAQDLGAWEFEQ